MRPEPLDETQIEGIVSKAIQDAVDFIEAEIAPQRIKAQRYFDMETDLDHEEGRSSVVATKCREVVRGIKPSLQRVFLANDKPVEFVPRGPEDVMAAEQATQFISYKFQQHDGYKLINDVFQDALVKKVGIAHVYYDESMKSEIHTFTGLDDDEFTFLVNEDDVNVLEHEVKVSISVDEMGTEVEMPVHDVKISREIPDGDICIESIPPEDFFVDRNARGIDQYYVCGHSTEMRIADLLAMGFKPEDLDGLDSTEYSVMAVLEQAGATLVDIELPHSHYAIATYYVIAPAEASANLARYDGVRFGYRCEEPVDLEDLYLRSRSEGFGEEVQRRILVGTYALSAGFYDAYFNKAQQVRRVITEDFTRAFDSVDVIAGPSAPGVAFQFGAKQQDPVAMYMEDIYTLAVNLAGLPGLSTPAGLINGMPVGLQLIGKPFDEQTILNAAHRLQSDTDWHMARPQLGAVTP